MEQKIKSPKHIVNWSLAKEQKEYNCSTSRLSINSVGTTRHPHAKMKIGTDLTPAPKITLKWTKIQMWSRKLLEGNTRDNLSDPLLGR